MKANWLPLIERSGGLSRPGGGRPRHRVDDISLNRNFLARCSP
jgi:hypothetical protein